MDVFKFQIGDIVLMKVGIAKAEMASSFPKECRYMPQPLMVIERRLQECPGGTQRHYLLSIGDNQCLCNEIELVSIQDFDSEPLLQACRKADSDSD